MTRLVAALFAICVTLPAYAHKASDAYLTLKRDGTVLEGQWDLALRDLETAIGLDADGDGNIRWGELRAKHGEIAAYAIRRLSLTTGGERCPLRVTAHRVDSHTDGAYAVLLLAGECGRADAPLVIHYTALFDVDPQHRGLVNFIEGATSRSVILSVDAPREAVGGDAAGPSHQFTSYVREGVWHIWIGADHLLFLVSLLLPSVLVRRDGCWQAAPSFAAAFWDVLRIVTAFTIAHSITLTLAALHVVAPPSRLVESAIAASVVLAALNNLVPVVERGRWLAALAFGLVHGFGFAGALQELGLPRGSLALSLAGFNVGVELGQLVIVAALLPAAFALRGTTLYRRSIMGGGSTLIAALATLWLVERAFDLPLLARFVLASG